jgi:preprotein translocase subunit SecD
MRKELKIESAAALREGSSDIVLKVPPADLGKIDNTFLKPNREQLNEGARDAAAGTVRLSIDDRYVTDIRDSAVRQGIETLRHRVDQFGVVEPNIVSKGTDLVIELPGLKAEDFERIKGVIGRTAQLEFKIAPDDNDYIKRVGDLAPKDSGITIDQMPWTGKNTGSSHSMWYAKAPTRAALEAFFSGLPADKQPPADLEIGYEEVQSRGEDGADGKPSPKGGKVVWHSYLLRKRAMITGEYLADASWGWDSQTNRPEVNFTWDREGTAIFEKATGENIDRKMAIILDNRINSAPVIESKIGQRGRITLGGFGDPIHQQNEAKDLAAVLKTGALPAPLRKTFETQVGPTLGRDAIASAKRSIGVGGMIVVALMLFYYKLSGAIAILAMLLNMLYMTAILAGFEASMTLPGIAGLGLTVGMAVDSNIIIYERIREELRLGKSPRSAVDAGFGHAFWTVVDAHVTNFVAGIVLYSYGSGPIRGFAVTLMVGIVANLFTSVWVSRAFFDLLVNRKRPIEQLSI